MQYSREWCSRVGGLLRSCRPLPSSSDGATVGHVRRQTSTATATLPPRWGPPPKGTKVHICLSGGVDSSVAACLLRDAGYDLRPLFMRNWESLDEGNGSGGCEWERDWEDVQRLCRFNLGGLEPELVDLSREYWTDVFEPALSDWQSGLTPNPDVACNAKIKFGALADRILGRDSTSWIATGHYARLMPSPHDSGVPALHRASYAPKDQSYYLSTSPIRAFQRTMFPLGDFTSKGAVRDLARKYKLHTAERRESMGICFVGVRKHFNTFLDSYLPPSPGNIEDDMGHIVGRHQGLWQYTVGQGARLAGFPEKLFVGRKDFQRNTITIVPAASPMLQCVSVNTNDLKLSSGLGFPDEVDSLGGWSLSAQTRSVAHGALVRCSVHRLPDASLTINFASPLSGVAPGQFVVLYDGDHCLGGGTIQSTETLWDQTKSRSGTGVPLASARSVSIDSSAM